MRTALILLAVTSLCSPSLVAQVAATPVGPGARVRLWVPDHDLAKRTATVTAVARDSLAVRIDNPRRRNFSGEQATTTDRTVAIADIERIEIMIDRRPNGLGGMKTGALVGGGTFLVVGFLSGTTCDELGCVDGNQTPALTLAGVLFGGAMGLLVGSLQTKEVWQQVWLGPEVPSRPDDTMAVRLDAPRAEARGRVGPGVAARGP